MRKRQHVINKLDERLALQQRDIHHKYRVISYQQHCIKNMRSLDAYKTHQSGQSFQLKLSQLVEGWNNCSSHMLLVGRIN